MAQQDIKSSLATKTTITANVATTTQIPQETTQPTQATTANQATNKNTATVTVTAPAPTEVKQDTTVNYNFDTNINTYLKTVKYLIDNFDGKKIASKIAEGIKLRDQLKSEVILKLKEIIPDDQIIYILENI